MVEPGAGDSIRRDDIDYPDWMTKPVEGENSGGSLPDWLTVDLQSEDKPEKQVASKLVAKLKEIGGKQYGATITDEQKQELEELADSFVTFANRDILPQVAREMVQEAIRTGDEAKVKNTLERSKNVFLSPGASREMREAALDAIIVFQREFTQANKGRTSFVDQEELDRPLN